MAIRGLQGPFKLTAEAVNRAVTSKRLPGAYALGHTDQEGTFVIEYIGRSNDNLRQQLDDLVVKFHGQFAFEYFSSARAAFEKECELFHAYLADGDAIHPTRPDGSYWKCPGCRALD